VQHSVQRQLYRARQRKDLFPGSIAQRIQQQIPGPNSHVLSLRLVIYGRAVNPSVSEVLRSVILRFAEYIALVTAGLFGGSSCPFGPLPKAPARSRLFRFERASQPLAGPSGSSSSTSSFIITLWSSVVYRDH
jgi:hypothetical protein